jgi:hypothetical protein
MVTSYLTSSLPRVRVGAVADMAVLLAFPDGVFLKKDAQRPTLQRLIGGS